jgi:hypothetical protein
MPQPPAVKASRHDVLRAKEGAVSRSRRIEVEDAIHIHRIQDQEGKEPKRVSVRIEKGKNWNSKRRMKE